MCVGKKCMWKMTMTAASFFRLGRKKKKSNQFENKLPKLARNSLHKHPNLWVRQWKESLCEALHTFGYGKDEVKQKKKKKMQKPPGTLDFVAKTAKIWTLLL